MRLLGVLSDHHYKEYIESGLDGFLFPLEDFSCDYQKTYSLEEIKRVKKMYPTALCFVIINQMIFQKKLEALEQVLKALEQMRVDGVLFYDTSVMYLVKQNHLQLPLYLHQTHFVTNAQMINEYHLLGVKGAYLSNEITKEEIFQITHKTKCELMMLLVGYPVVAMSRRHLITNYLQTHHEREKKSLEIVEPISKQTYHVRQTEAGTTFRYGKRLNYSNMYVSLQEQISYGILEQDDLTVETYQKLIQNFKKFNQLEIDKMIGHNRGFLYRKTIYQVKKK